MTPQWEWRHPELWLLLGVWGQPGRLPGGETKGDLYPRVCQEHESLPTESSGVG